MSDVDNDDVKDTLLGGDGDVVPKADDTVVPKADDTVVPKADDTVVPKADDTVVPKADDKVVADAKAPDSYSDFSLPEGFQWLDGQLEAMHKVGRDNNLSQEVMQNLIDLNVDSVKEGADSYAEAGAQAWEDTHEGWVETIKNDPELGGENLEATISNGRKAVQAFGEMVQVMGEDGKPAMGKDGKPSMVNDLAEALQLTGAGSHPVVVRAFAMLGKLVGEGGMVHGNMMPQKQPTAQRLYAKSNMNP